LRNEKGALAGAPVPKDALASNPEFTPSNVAFQAQVLAQRFALLPDTALAIANLAFEHIRGAP